MKLKRFFVDRHLLLNQLDLNFDRPNSLSTGKYALDFLVGLNGTGKTTVLRALTKVFANLRTGSYIDFDFDLEYIIRDYKIPGDILARADEDLKAILSGEISVKVSQKFDANEGHSKLTMEVVDKGVTSYYYDTIDEHYLPKRVVVYSSGNEAEWEHILITSPENPSFSELPDELSKDNIKRAIVELPGSMAYPSSSSIQEGEPPFWLMRYSRSKAITLCGILGHLASSNFPLREVLKSLQIHAIAGFSLRFRLHQSLSDFTLYEKLKDIASTCIRQGTDYLLTFDLASTPDIPSRIINEFGNSLEFFHELDKLQEVSDSGQPTLQEVNIFFVRESSPESDNEERLADEVPGLVLLDWLSDGEQSFLGRMALLAMLDTEESLIILDEPEVHFNDFWKRKIIQLIHKIMKEHTNQLLMTTHSTIVMSDVTSDQVFLFTKDESGITQVMETLPPIFGSDPGNIMVNLLGTGRAGGAYSKDTLEAAIERGEPEELKKLLDKVGPGYWQFRILDRLEGLDASPD